MMTPADTDRGSLEAALDRQLQLTDNHTHQLEAAAIAVQNLQVQVQPLQASVESLTQHQVASAAQQAEILIQLRALTAALTTQPPNQPPPVRAVIPPPGDPLPSSPAEPASLPWEPCLSSPHPFGGDFETCATFIMQCELVFTHQPSRYTSDAARVAYVTNLLTGRAAQWAAASWSMGASFRHSYREFVAELRKMFHHPVRGKDPGARLASIQQGSGSVADYSVDFRLAAAESGWNDPALRVAFRRGLCEAVKDQLATREEPASLDDLVSLAIRIDGRLNERRRERVPRGPLPIPHIFSTRERNPVAHSTSPSPVRPSTSQTATEEEPMQLGRTRISPAEREARFRGGLCLYCGQKGHRISGCPTRPKD